MNGAEESRYGKIDPWGVGTAYPPPARDPLAEGNGFFVRPRENRAGTPSFGAFPAPAARRVDDR